MIKFGSIAFGSNKSKSGKYNIKKKKDGQYTWYYIGCYLWRREKR